MAGITITPTSIFITYECDHWTIDRATGSIAPATNYIPITDSEDGLAVSCSNYAYYRHKIPQKLRPRWIEAMIKWRDTKLNISGNWETWLAWLDYIDPADFHEAIMTYNTLGKHLFSTCNDNEYSDQIQSMITDIMIVENVMPDPALIEGIKRLLAVVEREQVELLLIYGSCDFYSYIREKFQHHDDFASVRNIWHDFCRVMERRAKENGASRIEGKELVSH